MALEDNCPVRMRLLETPRGMCYKAKERKMSTEGESTGETPAELELRPSLLEEELLPAALTEGIALERIAPLGLGVVGVVAVIEPGPKFLVGQNLVRFINLPHLLLGLILGNALRGSLVGMVLLRQLAVVPLDRPVIRIATDPQDFVVVLLLRALQKHLCLLEERLDLLGMRVVLLGRAECSHRILESVLI